MLAAFLIEDLPEPDPVAARLAQLVEEIMRRPDIVRVVQVADLAGIGARHLQRLFGEYVGVSPKWVIDRRRLQTAAARGAKGDRTGRLSLPNWDSRTRPTSPAPSPPRWAAHRPAFARDAAG